MGFHEHISPEYSPPKVADIPQMRVADAAREGVKETGKGFLNRVFERFNPDRLDDWFVTPKAERKLPVEERFVGLRGESLARPDFRLENGLEVSKMLAEKRLEGIVYRNGYPDFRLVSEATVKIDALTTDRPSNFEKAYKALAEQWNRDGRDGRSDWKPSDVKAWKTENKLAIHECEDMRTCMFLPEQIHRHFPHSGGMQEARAREALLTGGGGKYGKFDA